MIAAPPEVHCVWSTILPVCGRHSANTPTRIQEFCDNDERYQGTWVKEFKLPHFCILMQGKQQLLQLEAFLHSQKQNYRHLKKAKYGNMK